MPLPRLRLLIILWLACLFGPATAATPSQRLADLAARYYQAQARFDPISATLSGDHHFDDQLAIDIAPRERQRRFGHYRRFLGELGRIPRAGLSADEQLTAELLETLLRGRLGFEPYPDHLLAWQQMDPLPIVVASFASGQAGQPLDTVAQHEAYLRRLARLPQWFAQAEANLREGLRRGVVQSRPVMTAALPALRGLTRGELDANPYAEALRHLPAEACATERERLREAYADLIRARIAPAARRLLAFVEADYLPRTRAEAIGWSALPDGMAWYRQWVREQTTTDLDPEAIHALGLQEVARIRAGLAEVGAALGAPAGANVLAWAREQARFKPFRTEAEVLGAYEALNQRVGPQLPTLFGRVPKAPLKIRPEPALTRATASDHYAFSVENGQQLGVFWAVIDDPARYSVVGMTSLFLHEGQPGHHFHGALQAELNLPDFRKYTWVNAFGEGWALYAETLGHELGLYRDDPVARLGHLQGELARAARLVVDTGLHARGWSRELAMAYWIEQVGATPESAARAIDRYLAWPGQALGYKIGALQIQALRREAETALGPRFRLADFHDQVLGAGSLPLAVLKRRIEAWIAAQP
jgi:uncharacterized protein (DUF885 family)